MFDFDRYTPEIADTIGDILDKHGLAQKNLMSSEYLAAKRTKENIQVTVNRYSGYFFFKFPVLPTDYNSV